VTARGWLGVAALLVAGCGGPTATPESPEAARPALVELAPPGSRLTVRAPAAERIAHSLRYRAGPLELRFADAAVAPGAERDVAEAYLADLSATVEGEVRHQPFSLAGHQGLQVTVRGETTRVRALTLWTEDGAISRVTIVHPPDAAGLAERVVESLRFSPARPLDPRAALELDADPVPGLPLLRVSTEQLIFREAGHAVTFPSPDAAVDVAYVAFDGEPPDERGRGELLGARFRGIAMDAPQVAPVEGGRLPGFAMKTTAIVAGRELALLGAYLGLEEGALLVRASVDSARTETWMPRFAALVRSLRPR